MAHDRDTAARTGQTAHGAIAVSLARARRAGARVWTHIEPRARAVAIVLGVLLALPALASPPLLDDLAHRAMLFDRIPGVSWGPLELYDFVGAPSRPPGGLRDSGTIPWFSADDLKIRFFRPLSSALLATEARLDDSWAWVARLHSLAWLLASISIAAVLHRRMLTASTAALATVIYALAPAHTMPASWIAARYALVCTTFALLAFWLHLRAREDGWRPGRWLSLAALCTGLLAGETALGAVALIGAWEVFGGRDPLPRRIRAALPVAVLTAAYLTWYIVRDYGAHGSGIYVGADGGWAGAWTVAVRLLILTAELITATPSDAFGPGAPAIEIAGALWGVAAAAGAWILWNTLRNHIPPRDRSQVGWMVVAAVAAALPGAFGSLGGRVLPIALMPASAAVAMLLAAVWTGPVVTDTPGLRRRLPAAAGLVLVAGHFLLAPVFRLVAGLELTRISRETYEQGAHVPPCPGTLVIVAAADPTISTYVPALLALGGRAPERLRVLSMAPAEHRIEAVTTRGFDLVVVDGPPTRTLWERLYRRDALAAGARVRIADLDALVVEAAGDRPTRLRFDFGMPLESDSICFLAWHGGRLRPIDIAEGRITNLPHEPGPMGW